jgi:hypothetical protein
LLKLEQAFEKNHYVVGAERKQLAQTLSLSETQVSHVSQSFLLPKMPTKMIKLYFREKTIQSQKYRDDDMTALQ